MKTKTFDCVEMMHCGAEEVRKKTKDMPLEEQVEFRRKQSELLRQMQAEVKKGPRQNQTRHTRPGGRAIDETRLRARLQKFRDDGLSMDDVVAQLRKLPYQDLDFANVDHHRFADPRGRWLPHHGRTRLPEETVNRLRELLHAPYRGYSPASRP